MHQRRARSRWRDLATLLRREEQAAGKQAIRATPGAVPRVEPDRALLVSSSKRRSPARSRPPCKTAGIWRGGPSRAAAPPHSSSPPTTQQGRGPSGSGNAGSRRPSSPVRTNGRGFDATSAIRGWAPSGSHWSRPRRRRRLPGC